MRCQKANLNDAEIFLEYDAAMGTGLQAPWDQAGKNQAAVKIQG